MTMLQPVSEQPECDKHMRGAAASGRLDLASMDVSMDEGGELDLSTTSAGGLRAARAGLHDQQGAAQDAEALEALLHEFMARLSPADRVTLSFALGNRSAAAAAAEQGLSRQASHAALQRVVRKLRAQLQAAAASDAEVAALLKQ
jgi:DNA-directed RNA polymerase specialized sigma24 family protein